MGREHRECSKNEKIPTEWKFFIREEGWEDREVAIPEPPKIGSMFPQKTKTSLEREWRRSWGGSTGTA
jgi:hypothetical protein